MVDALVRVQGRDAVEGVCDQHAIEVVLRRAGRLDDERAEEAAADLLRGRLVRVVPERPDLLRAKAVDVTLAGRDGVLRHACDAVLGVRHVDAVPVDRHALCDVRVREGHLDEVALRHPELGPGRALVERQRVDLAARGELDRRVPGRQREPRVGRPLARAVQGLDADTARVLAWDAGPPPWSCSP